MRELERRQKFRRRLYSYPVLAALLVVTVLLVRGAYSMLLTERDSQRSATLLSLEVETLREREAVLKDGIERLETEAGLEEEIKSKFNVARPGEHVAIIVDRPEDAATTTPEKTSWWKRIWADIIDSNE